MQRVRWTVRAALLLAGSIALLCLTSTTPAQAHASLVTTDPNAGTVLAQAPASVVLTFDEAVEPVTGGFELYSASGRTDVAATRSGNSVQVALPKGLADGSYALVWHVYSTDAHPLADTLRFAVGQQGAVPVGPDAPATLSPVAAGYGVNQALGYLGLTVMIGLVGFELLVVRGAPTSRGRRRLVVGAGVVTVLTAAVGVPLSAARLAGNDVSRLWSPLDWLRLPGGGLLAGLLAVVGALALVGSVRAGAVPRRGLAIVGLALALLSFPVVGHTRSFEPGWLLVVADLIHAAAASTWIGGLVGLVAYVVSARRRDEPVEESARVVARFSGLAGLTVAVLAVAGVVLAVVMMGSLADVRSAYGVALGVKIALVLAAAGIALWNRTRLVPTILRCDWGAAAWGRLTRLLAYEVLILVAVITATTVLTLQNPRANDVPPPAQGHEMNHGQIGPMKPGGSGDVALGTGVMHWSIAPGVVGPNTVALRYTDREGVRRALAELPAVAGYQPQSGAGPVPATVTEQGETYRAEVDLATPGPWLIQVSIRDEQGSEFVTDGILVLIAQ
ncbi:MAG TPA: copper resistance protein CopC [Propionibacteriaceae bacterium]